MSDQVSRNAKNRLRHRMRRARRNRRSIWAEQLEARHLLAGDLEISLNVAPNFVVDSNVQTPAGRSPTAAYLMAEVSNRGDDKIDDVFLHFGDHFDNGGNDSTGLTGDAPGVYPSTSWPGLTGEFSFTHEGGVADATRFIGTLEPGETRTHYWLVSYPVLDETGAAIWGAQSDPSDDLVLSYDVWATADAGGVLQEEVIHGSANMRNEITAMANKIWPNTDSKVPDEYVQAINEQLGWSPNQIAPGLAVTQGIWYDMGNVNQGFDNDGDSIPDYNLWMQPVGDASVFDANAWRLAKTYGVLIVKLNDGTEQLIAFEDQLYHTDIPANNTGVVGLAYYAFAPIGYGAGLLSPYQEAASGSDNEKYNGDYGTYVGGPEGTPPEAEFTKTGPATILPGETLDYSMTAFVPATASSPFGLSDYGAPVVISDAIPFGTQYVTGSAAANNTLPGDVTATILYSSDDGYSWTSVEPATGVTHLQWWLSGSISQGETATVTFSADVPVTYLNDTSTQVDNCASVGLGSGSTLYTDCQQTVITGTLNLSGLVWQDDGGGVDTGDGVRQASETVFLDAITVTLYPDVNQNGLLDPEEREVPRAVTESVIATGAWQFSNLPDGDYLVEIRSDDPDRPNGYILSSDQVIAVSLNGVDESGLEFGFSPTLDLTKNVLTAGPYLEGQTVTYQLNTSNLTKPGDFLLTQPVVHELWLGSGSGTYLDPTNAAGAPDGLFATGNTNAQDLTGFFTVPQSYTPVGSIAKVEAVLQTQLSGVLSADSLDVTVHRNGSVVGSYSLSESSLHAFITQDGLIAFDVSSMASWAWADFSAADTGLTLAINGGGSIPSISIDSFGFRVTTGSLPSQTGNVFWADGDADLKYVPPSVAPAEELNITLQSVASPPQEIAFDELRRHVFLGYSSGLIERRDLDGSNPVTIATGQTSLSGMAVDSLHGYVYWTRAGSVDQLHRADVDGANLIAPITGLANPEGVAVDPLNAQVYWVQTQGSNLQIRKSNLDLELNSIVDLFAPTVIGSGNHNPVDLEIDPIRQKLYWADDKSGTAGDFIGSVNLDGTALAVLVPEPDPNFGHSPSGIGINVETGTVYWSDFTGIHQVDVSGTTSTLATDTAVSTDVEVAGNFKFVGAYDANKTLVSVPLVDDYDPNELRFVSASVAPSEVDEVNGRLVWDNVGPIHPQETHSIDVIFELLAPPNNETNSNVLNQAAVTNAITTGGLDANEGTDSVSIVVEPTASIGDTIWSNLNGNSVQEAGESGIPGVLIELISPTGSVIAKTVTDIDGNYLFKGVHVPDGTTESYTVRVDATTLPTGAVNNFDPDGGTLNESVVAITNPVGSVGPADNLDQDFGYSIPNLFFGTVYEDSDQSGSQDATENPISGVVVYLKDVNGVIVSTTTTNVDGYYQFDVAAAGSYYVEVDRTGLLDVNYLQTEDPDATADSRITTAVTVTTGEVKGSYDFGYYQGGDSSIGDQVFIDPNRNNVMDVGERGIASIDVRLFRDQNADGVYQSHLDSFVAVTQTNANGYYQFPNLAAGNYLVVVDESDSEFPVGLQVVDQNPVSVILPASTDYVTADFGYFPTEAYVEPGSIGDFVFYDANRNGQQDTYETGIGNVELRLYADTNGNLVFDAGDIDHGTTFTSMGNPGDPPIGFYQFTNLAPDSNALLPGNNPYLVEVVSIPADSGTSLAQQTADPQRDGVPSWDQTYPGMPAADNQDSGHFVDLNLNGVNDPGEEGIYLSAGTHYTGADFGYQPTGVIGDYVWLDLNQDGTQDANEVAVTGVTITASNVAFGGSETYTTTTDEYGQYSFYNLPDGDWRITMSPPAGLAAGPRVDSELLAGVGSVGSASVDVALVNGDVESMNIGGNVLNFASSDPANNTAIDFGLVLSGPYQISGTVVLEDKGAGLQDGNSGEVSDLAAAGVTVFLRDAAGRLLGTALTDSSGYYEFTGLPQSDYVVAMAANTILLSGSEFTTDDYAPSSVPAGVSVVDFGGSATLSFNLSSNLADLDFAWLNDLDVDFGDLSDSYGTSRQNNGAGHIQVAATTLLLGALIDTEFDASINAAATGDDNQGIDDEDGVVVLDSQLWADGADANNQLQIQVTGSGYLMGWMDFNQDGDFFDVGELVVSQSVVSGTNTYPVDVPPGTLGTNGVNVASRFRLFGAEPLIPELASVGLVEAGEVEDYVFPLGTLPAAYTISKSVVDIAGRGAAASVIAAGEVIQYSIVVTNTGGQSITNLVITDPLLSGVGGSVVSSVESIAQDDVLEVGETITVTGTYTVQQSDLDNNGGGDGDIDNTASVVSTEIPTPISDSTTTPLVQSPLYTIVKTVTDVDGQGASANVDAAGDVISYSIVVTNTGNISLNGVVINDPLLEGANGTLSAVVESGVVDGVLSVGETFTVTGSYTVQQSDLDNNGGGDGDIDNTASVVSTEIPAPINDSAATPITQSPTYTIVKTVTDVDGQGASASVDAVGDVISYSIVVTNTGNISLNGVEISDPLLQGANGTLGAVVESGVVDGFLSVGETFTVTGTYTVQQTDLDNNGGGDGDIDNTVSVISTEIPAPITDSTATPITQSPAYTIVKTVTDVDGQGASASVDAAEDVISYSIVVTNTGNISLNGVEISDPLLQGANGTFGAVVESGVADGVLSVGETFTVTGTYTVQQSDLDDNGGGDGDIDNTASVVSTEIPTPISDSTTTPLVQSPLYTIVKTVTDVDGQGASASIDAAGDVISYSIVVTNTGNISLSDVVISDPLLQGANGTFGAVVESGVADGVLSVGETFTVTGTYTVQQSDLDDNGGGDGDIDNTASVISTEIPAPITDSTATPITQSPTYTIVKTVTDVDGQGASASVDAASDVISYSIVVTNTGNISLNGVVITDPLLEGASGTFGAVVESGVADGILSVGETFTVTGSYTVQQSDLDNNGGGDGDIDNTASVISTEIPAPLSDSTQTPIVSSQSYTIVKTVTDVDGQGASASIDAAGDVISYSIVVANTGNISFTGVVISDLLLEGDNGTFGAVVESGVADGVLSAGETFTVTGTYTVQQSDLDNNGGGDGDIDNTASVVSTEIPAPITDSTATPITQSPAYTIVKTVTDVDGQGTSAGLDAAGDVISYSIVVTNTGNISLNGVVITDPLLEGANGTLSAVVESGTADGILSVGETFTVTGSYTVQQSDLDDNGGGDGDIDNTASVISTQIPAPISDSTTTPLVQSPLYTIVKTVTDVDGQGAGASIDAVGDVISYSIVVTNTGNISLNGIVISDPLLEGANGTFGAVVESGSADGVLSVGETFTVTGTYTVQQSDLDNNGGGDGDIDNTASVVSTQIPAPITDSTATPITQSPAYTIVKTVTDVDGQGASASVDASEDVISYSIVVTNTGNISLNGIVISDPLLEGANGTFAAVVESGSADGVLSVGETFTVTGTYTAQQSDLDNNGGGDGDIDNTASVISTEIPAPITDSTATPITQSPAYTIIKTVTDVDGQGASASVDAVGDVINYSIVVTNTGNISLTGVVISDPLLEGANGTFGAVVESGVADGVLSVGETFTVTGTYTVQQTDLDNNGGGDGDIDNTASVISTEIPAPITDNTATPITQSPAYTIVKTVTDVDGQGASASVDAAEDVISYSIVVTNTGNISLNGVVISDPLLEGANGTFGAVVESGVVDGVLSVGETFTVTGSFTVQQSDLDDNGGGDGDIDNTASVVSTEIPAPITDSTATPITQSPAYTIVKTVTDVDGQGASASVDAAGDVINYSIVVTNTGNISLNGVVISDPLLQGANGTFGAVVESGAADGVLSVGETFTVTGTYTVQQSDLDNNGGGDGDIDNTASVISTEIPAPITDSTSTPVLQLPAFSSAKTVVNVGGDGANGLVNAVGDLIQFEIVVSNTGNLSLTGILVSDPLLEGDGGSIGAPTESLLADGILNVGETWVYAGSYQVTDTDLVSYGNGTGQIQNIAMVSVQGLPDQQVTAEADLDVADLSLTKQLDYVDSDTTSNLSVGDEVLFTLSVTNQGPDVASGVSIRDQLPAGYSFSSASGVGSYDPVPGIWSLPELAVGETLSIVLHTTILGFQDLFTGAYRNQAEIYTSDQFDPDSQPGDTSSGDDDDARVMPSISDLSLAKSVSSVSPAPGDVVTFTVTLQNDGPDDATGVSVVDRLPSGFSAISNISHNGQVIGDQLTWDEVVIEAGAAVTFSFDAQVLPYESGISYENHVEVTAMDQFDPDSTVDRTPDRDDPQEDDEASVAVSPTGSLSGNVFWDRLVDGVQNSDSPYLNGIEVKLYRDADGDGIAEPDADDGVFVASRITSEDLSGQRGHYLFSGLSSGGYFVTFTPIPASQFSEPFQTADESKDSDVNPASGATSVVSLQFGQSVESIDAGMFGQGSVGDRIWNDTNRDGVQTSDETAMNGVEVTLVWFGPDGLEGGDDDIVLSMFTTTGLTPEGEQNGIYGFDHLFAGNYRIRVTPPNGTDPTFDPDGGNDHTTQFSLPEGEVLVTQDFGYTGDASLSGFVFLDADFNAQISVGDYGVGGTQIVLTGFDVYGGTVNRQSTTNAIGYYEFVELLPGTYELLEIQPVGFVDFNDYPGPAGGVLDGSDEIREIVLSNGTAGDFYNFTEKASRTLISKRQFLGDQSGSLFGIRGTVRLTAEDLANPGDVPLVIGDTNGDGLVTALDALTVINAVGEGELVDRPSNTTHSVRALDVNGDGSITARDALNVINLLNRQGDGEGESLSLAWNDRVDRFFDTLSDEEESILELFDERSDDANRLF